MKRMGFTLIELLIVIAIIAILALIAIPNFMEAQVRAKVSRAHADMRTIATALEAYFVDHNAYPRVDWRVPFDHDNRSWSKRLWFESPNNDPGARCIALLQPIAYLSTRPPVDPFLDAERYYTGNPGIYYTDYSFHYYNFLDAARHQALWPAEWNNPANTDGNGVAQLVAPAPMRFGQGYPGHYTDRWREAPVHYANWALLSYGPDRKSTDRNLDPTGPPTNYSAAKFLSGAIEWNHLLWGRTQIYDPTNGTVSGGNIWRFSGGSDAN